MMNKLTKLLSVILVLVLFVGLCALPIGVSAEEVSSEAKKVISLIEKLPADPETVTAQHKEAIVEAKTAYNELAPEQRIEIPTETLTRLNNDYSAVVPFIMEELAKKLKELPTSDKAKESDKENILALYADFAILDQNTREAFSNEYIENLLGSVYRLDPEKLTEEDAETISVIEEKKKAEAEKKAKAEAEKKAKQKALLEKIAKYAFIIFLTLIVLAAFAIMVIMVVKVLRLAR